jgi:hypothetical protein
MATQFCGRCLVASNSAFLAVLISVIFADFSMAMLNVASIFAMAESAPPVPLEPLAPLGLPPPPQLAGGVHDIESPCIEDDAFSHWMGKPGQVCKSTERCRFASSDIT